MGRPSGIAEMIDDSFANYVVQTALDFAQGDLRAQLMGEIMPLLSTIKSRSWYKRILTKLGLAVNHSFGHHETTGRHLMSRQFVEDSLPPRMGRDQHRSGLGSMHSYPPIHSSERSIDH